MGEMVRAAGLTTYYNYFSKKKVKKKNTSTNIGWITSNNSNISVSG